MQRQGPHVDPPPAPRSFSIIPNEARELSQDFDGTLDSMSNIGEPFASCTSSTMQHFSPRVLSGVSLLNFEHQRCCSYQIQVKCLHRTISGSDENEVGKED